MRMVQISKEEGGGPKRPGLRRQLSLVTELRDLLQALNSVGIWRNRKQD